MNPCADFSIILASWYVNKSGMAKRNIFGMNGYGGQSVLIDMDNSRIVVVNAASTNYDWYELVYQPIKTGKLKKHSNCTCGSMQWLSILKSQITTA